MLQQAMRSLGERLYEVIRVDIVEGALPAGARGLDSSEATGMFKAAVQRLREMERDRADDHDD
jgi:DNA-binding GntR family transcriptional regulator